MCETKHAKTKNWTDSPLLIAALEVLGGSTMKEKMKMLIGCWRNMSIHDVSEDVKEFWAWYGLTLLPKASRREWPWHQEDKRRTKLMNECVSASDEALALQIMELRGDTYLVPRTNKGTQNMPVKKPKKGRKKKEALDDC